jgi:hypothetical protein
MSNVLNFTKLLILSPFLELYDLKEALKFLSSQICRILVKIL